MVAKLEVKHKSIKADDVMFLMIDEQEKLCQALDPNLREKVKANTIKLLATAQEFDIPLLVTEQNPSRLGPSNPEFEQYYPENFEAAWEMGFGTQVMPKMAFSCCDEIHFHTVLQNYARNTVVIFGVETHICVLMTAMDLIPFGYKPVIISDACGSRTKENHEQGLQTARDAGALVMSTESLIYQVLRTCESRHFKKLHPILK